MMGQSTSSIAFTSGFYDTVVVKFWQILPSYGEVVGLYYSNHFLQVGENMMRILLP